MERRSLESIVGGIPLWKIVMGEATDPVHVVEPGWDRGWEGHADAQRRRIAALPLWVRIDWLEETQRMLARLRPVEPQKPDDKKP